LKSLNNKENKVKIQTDNIMMQLQSEVYLRTVLEQRSYLNKLFSLQRCLAQIFFFFEFLHHTSSQHLSSYSNFSHLFSILLLAETIHKVRSFDVERMHVYIDTL